MNNRGGKIPRWKTSQRKSHQVAIIIAYTMSEQSSTQLHVLVIYNDSDYRVLHLYILTRLVDCTYFDKKNENVVINRKK